MLSPVPSPVPAAATVAGLLLARPEVTFNQSDTECVGGLEPLKPCSSINNDQFM
jgi:hypothetical protein